MKFGLLAATIITAGVLALGPASARMMGCTSAGLAKTQSTVDAMADTPTKFMMQREIGLANTAISTGDMRGCAMHMNRVERMTTTPAMGSSGM